MRYILYLFSKSKAKASNNGYLPEAISRTGLTAPAQGPDNDTKPRMYWSFHD